jgi:hypothetical protein
MRMRTLAHTHPQASRYIAAAFALSSSHRPHPAPTHEMIYDHLKP